MLRNLSIRVRLGLTLFPLLVCLLVLSASVLSHQKATLDDTRALMGLRVLAVASSDVVHELQKERGSSSLFLGSQGKQFSSELRAQRQRTDTAFAALITAIGTAETGALDPETHKAMAEARREVERQLAARDRVDALALAPAEVIGGYTVAINRLLDAVAGLALVSNNADVNRRISAYLALMAGKERAGRERATAAAGFAAGNFSVPLYNRLASLSGEQEAFFETFQRLAFPAQRDALQQALAAANNAEYLRFRQAALQAPPGTGNLGVDPALWFAAATARIDRLREVEAGVGREIDTYVANLTTGVKEEFSQILLAVALGGGLAILIMVLVARSITRPLHRLTGAMRQLARGEIIAEVDGTDYRDEIGLMATAMKIFRDNLLEQRRLEEEKVEAEARERALGRQLAADAHGHLDGIVEIAVRSNNVFFGLAQLIGRVKAVAADSQVIAAAITEMVTSIKEISRNSTDAAEAAREAEGSSGTGIKSAREAADTMSRISQAVEASVDTVTRLETVSGQIGSMVASIDGIAKQTNLLALNATIEAARAGAAGKGFAVVAHEVKQLANQTGTVTDDIRKRIDLLRTDMGQIVSRMSESADAVSHGGETMNGLGSQMAEIKTMTSHVTVRMAEISAILSQQSASSDEIANTAGEIAHRAEDNNKTLVEVLDTMDGALSVLNGRVDKFSVLGTDHAIVLMAKKDHCQFKNSIVNAVLGRTVLAAEKVSDHQSCRFGKWYTGLTRADIRNSAPYRDIDEPHRAVHQHGRNAVNAAARGDEETALREVALMNEASNRVLRCLDAIAGLVAVREAA